MLPSPDILNDFPHGKFVLSNLAAKRAKQLREGAPALVHVDSTHPLTIALAEIAAGKIKAIMSTVTEALEPADEVTVLIGESVPAELGMLLPALDEQEAALVGSVTVLGEEEGEELVEPEEAISLSDLVGDQDDEEAPDVSPEDDTLSLSDIAEQETVEDDDTDEA
jgi:DNA-directed RNA polymerase subunit omega